MPIRILHVIDSLGKGGLENGVVNVIRGLDTNFEHIVLAIRQLGPNAERLPADRVRIEGLEKKAGSRTSIGSLVGVIRRLQPHVVHSRNWGEIEAVFAARIARAPAVVHSEHGIDTS